MKPMLAATASEEDFKFPMLVSRKLDGVRALVIGGVVMSRSLKPIPNERVQKLFGRAEYNGLDGELIVGEPGSEAVYRTTMSGVMTKKGVCDATFWVFDDFLCDGGYADRYAHLIRRVSKIWGRGILTVPHHYVTDLEGLLEIENACLLNGYEGVMIRSLAGPYKFGRSTANEGYLLKVKRFEDSEAFIVGAEELMHNGNEAEVNELGQKARSSKKDGMVGMGTLGSLEVIDLKTRVWFNIGTGFDPELRAKIWRLRETDLQNGWGWMPNVVKTCEKNPGKFFGQVVKYKHQTQGAKDKPRFPVFLGFRDPIDL